MSECPICHKEKKRVKAHMRLAHPQQKVSESPILSNEVAPEAPAQIESVARREHRKLKPIPWAMVFSTFRLLLAIGLAGLGLVVAVVGNSQRNPSIILMGVVALVLALLCFWWWRNNKPEGDIDREVRGEAVSSGPVKVTQKYNALILEPQQVRFANLPSDQLQGGQSQLCHNDGKRYFVLLQKDGAGYEQLVLPEQRYYSPAEFANVVTMPNVRRYLSWSNSFVQTVSVVIMGLIIVGEFIALIAIP